jgi:hypothetical protein
MFPREKNASSATMKRKVAKPFPPEWKMDQTKTATEKKRRSDWE